ncbi:uncharacterized protein BP5553_09363 [Venustampulla echinocandica]|uniref:alpha-galactosidase n=1 Tax=Venustampulla echinocandica TaxID=2656787 RepID=A0A370TCK4_9HELO|nr:uncharacterized protein BP5553_09363 [Venustampulla echinocandica]RDL31961.1 hypothetical protein BP5553_09363 [Venustampulla echinocandica]
MRSILSISLALGALYQQTSVVAIPLERRFEVQERHWGGHRHRKGHGHGNPQSTLTTLPSAVETANSTGTVIVPLSSATGAARGTVATKPKSKGDNNDEDEDDDEDDDDDDEDDEDDDEDDEGDEDENAAPTSKAGKAPVPTKTGGKAPVPTKIATGAPLPTKIATGAPLPTKIATGAPVPASSAAGAPVPTSTAAVPAAGSIWKPAAGTTWQIQITNAVTDVNMPVDVYDIDLFDNKDSGVIQKLQANGKKVICYFSAGSFEDWRPDQSSFAEADKGSDLDGWPGERWLNTNSPNVRKIMSARLDLAKTAGCDAVDPDNVDVYENKNGINIKFEDSISYMQWLSDEAHSRGMAIGLKNGGDMVKSLLSSVEFQVNEQCVEMNECELFVPFVKANKPVFHIEYPSGSSLTNSKVVSQFCVEKASNNFSTVLKDLDLDSKVQFC